MTAPKIFSVIVGAIILATTSGCSPRVSWSDAERENSEHFFRALEAMQRATQLSNAAQPGVLQLGIEEILEQQRTALAEAKLVQDQVLDKAHPDLREHFRSQFQKGLELIIRGEETGLGSKDPRIRQQIDFGVTGTVLVNTWIEWLDTHRNEIHIPDKRKSPWYQRLLP